MRGFHEICGADFCAFPHYSVEVRKELAELAYGGVQFRIGYPYVIRIGYSYVIRIGYSYVIRIGYPYVIRIGHRYVN